MGGEGAVLKDKQHRQQDRHEKATVAAEGCLTVIRWRHLLPFPSCLPTLQCCDLQLVSHITLRSLLPFPSCLLVRP